MRLPATLTGAGVGDVWTLTVKEYIAMSRWDRIVYRMVRNPIILFGIAPSYVFLDA